MSAALHVWESRFVVYRRIWRSNALGSFVQPMLYLLGMGVGVGTLVDRGTGGAGDARSAVCRTSRSSRPGWWRRRRCSLPRTRRCGR